MEIKNTSSQAPQAPASNQNSDIPKLEVKASTEKPNIAAGIGKYMMDEYIVPQAKDTLHDLFAKMLSGIGDALQGGLNKAFYGEDNGRRYTSNRSTTTNTSYTSFYTRPSSSTSFSTSNDISRRSSTEVQVVIVDHEEDAKRLVNYLQNLIQNYKVAKVSDLYSSLQPKVQVSFTDYKYGWTNPNEIGYRPIYSGPNRGKYQLDLPQPIDISNVQ